MLRGGAAAEPEDAAPLLAELAARIGIGGLDRFGVGRGDFPEIARKAAASSSMRGNPVVLTDGELFDILEAATFMY
jgi:alcohol dehydrogenase class IV